MEASIEREEAGGVPVSWRQAECRLSHSVEVGEHRG